MGRPVQISFAQSPVVYVSTEIIVCHAAPPKELQASFVNTKARTTTANTSFGNLFYHTCARGSFPGFFERAHCNTTVVMFLLIVISNHWFAVFSQRKPCSGILNRCNPGFRICGLASPLEIFALETYRLLSLICYFQFIL